MCPACAVTTTVLVAGGISASGIVALLFAPWKRLRKSRQCTTAEIKQDKSH